MRAIRSNERRRLTRQHAVPFPAAQTKPTPPLVWLLLETVTRAAAKENKSNMSRPFDANAQSWLCPSGDLNCYPPLELKCDLVQSPGLPLGLNWLGMEFQEFSEFFSETLVS